ncbi:hypothetical protein [Hansschlegelia sp.]|uniref:hypothetical protein n=1 Tax=Hansschlegelia sp. TaxID=2041892 RepID=UPI002C9DA57B|nr:hypothetical protein [Hansschlegelia sp.]HVI27593.1 hypothetical protein [Hansschlegelia sp.]
MRIPEIRVPNLGQDIFNLLLKRMRSFQSLLKEGHVMGVVVASDAAPLVAHSMTYRGSNLISFAGTDPEGYDCEVMVNCFQARVTLRAIPTDTPEAKKYGFELPSPESGGAAKPDEEA